MAVLNGYRSASLKPKKTASQRKSSKAIVTDDQLEEQVAEQAFQIFESRGRVHGFDKEDWFQAKSLVNAKNGLSESD